MKCKECGTDFKAKQYNAEFCCGKHRNEFNNRRAGRGAALYDLEMLKLHEPAYYAEHKLADVRENLLAHWAEEDKTVRAGRKSWKRAFDVMADLVRFRG